MTYKEAYKHLGKAIELLEGYSDFESIRDDLIILKRKMTIELDYEVPEEELH